MNKKSDTVEIIGWGGIENAFRANSIDAKKTYEVHVPHEIPFAIYEITREELDWLNTYTEDTWLNQWGWYCYSDGSNMGVPDKKYIINGIEILAWDDERERWCVDCPAYEKCNRTEKEMDFCYQRRRFDHLFDYFHSEIGVSQMRNITALSVDLAKYNGMTLAELFKKTTKGWET